MARLILHVHLVKDRINILAGIGVDRLLDVPLHHLAVQEQRGIGVALVVKRSVKRTKAQLRFCNNGGPGIGVFREQRVNLVHIDHGNGRRQLAVDHDVFLVRRGVHAMRRVRDRDIAGQVALGPFAPVHDLGAVQLLVFAGFDGRFDRLDVEHHHVVHLARGHLGQVHAHF